MRFVLSNDGNLCGFVVPGQFFFNFYISGMIPTIYPIYRGGWGGMVGGANCGCLWHRRKSPCRLFLLLVVWLCHPFPKVSKIALKIEYRGIVWGGCFGCQ